MSEPTKRKRRWFQFSLRSLMIFTAIVAVEFGWLGSKIAKKRQEQALVAGIREHGGGVEYDSSVPTSLRWLLGGNFFNDVQYAWITRADDATLRSLAELTRLRGLHLFADGVTDAGLANLKGLAQLQWLYVDNTLVTDAGLVNLKGMTQLQWLRLENNNVTDTGFTNLKKALPNCQITALSLGSIPVAIECPHGRPALTPPPLPVPPANDVRDRRAYGGAVRGLLADAQRVERVAGCWRDRQYRVDLDEYHDRCSATPTRARPVFNGAPAFSADPPRRPRICNTTLGHYPQSHRVPKTALAPATRAGGKCDDGSRAVQSRPTETHSSNSDSRNIPPMPIHFRRRMLGTVSRFHARDGRSLVHQGRQP